MLYVEHVSKTFNPGTINERKALIDVSLHIKPGEFVTVIGGNGAGKSTILNAIAGLWPIDDGAVILDGENITGLPEYKRAPYIGRVFQDPMMGTAASMQIEENLALAKRRGQKRTLKWGITKAEKEEFREKLAILGLGLEDRMTTKVGLLSGGWLDDGFAAVRKEEFLRFVRQEFFDVRVGNEACRELAMRAEIVWIAY